MDKWIRELVEFIEAKSDDAPRWHDGPGWYYVDREYPEEGSVGAFNTLREAMDHAIDVYWDELHSGSGQGEG